MVDKVGMACKSNAACYWGCCENNICAFSTSCQNPTDWVYDYAIPQAKYYAVNYVLVAALLCVFYFLMMVLVI